MMGPRHQMIGGSTALIATTAAGLPIPVDVAVVAVAAASSSLPDQIETWVNFVGRKLHIKLLQIPHRRLTHWPSMQIGVVAVIAAALLELTSAEALYVLPVAAGVGIGCLAHSLADAMTIHPQGIQLLWPISARGYHLLPHALRVKVGSKSRSEWLFSAIWAAFVLSYLYVRYRHQVLS
jgi:membrane-bound metal-dependent hydrolase YbcI (DUF457 family)